MNESDGGKPPAAWLEHLREAKHWDRLIAIAGKSLEVDPNDPVTHRHIAWAYAASDRPAKMWPHVEFLLNRETDEASSHHLAAVYYLDTSRHKEAWPHVQMLLQKNPNSATYHYLACLYALRVNNMALARHHIEQARKLAPDWVPAAHLEIRMDGVRQRKASDAWGRIRRLEKTLSLDPQNAGVMTTIGEIYLGELERPREAERFFRQALHIEPGDKDRQAHLLDAIRARSLLYRTLSLPTRTGKKVIDDFRRKPMRLILLLAITQWMVFAAWVILLGAVFTPCAKIYEWLVLMDATQVMRLPRWLTPLAPVFRWPLWLRISCCYALFIGLWLVILRLAFHLRLEKALAVMGLVFGIHYGFVALVVGLRKLRAQFGKWQDRRRERREARLTVGQAVV